VQTLEFLEAFTSVILSYDLLLHDPAIINHEDTGRIVSLVGKVYAATLAPSRHAPDGRKAGRREDKVHFLGVKVTEKLLTEKARRDAPEIPQ
jgi:hypothetical protein